MAAQLDELRDMFMGPANKRRRLIDDDDDTGTKRRRTNNNTFVVKRKKQKVPHLANVFAASPAVSDAPGVGKKRKGGRARGPRYGMTGYGRTQHLAHERGNWHPLFSVKRAISEFLPKTYSTQYEKDVYISKDDGKFVSPTFAAQNPNRVNEYHTTATKVRWRKVLGDVMTLRGIGRYQSMTRAPQGFRSQKRWRQAVGQKALFRRHNPYLLNAN